MSQNTLNISGRVIDRTKQKGAPDLRVEAHHNDSVASGVTDDRGAFKIVFDESRYPGLFKDQSPALIFTFNVFDRGTLIKTTQEAVPRDNKGSAFEIDIVLTLPTDTTQFVVRGTVQYSNGRVPLDVVARAFDKDLRSEQLLGETAIDGAGRYEIRYTAERFRRCEKKQADLIVRAFDERDRVVAASPVIFNAAPEQTIDLVIGNEAYRGPSEYEQLVAELTPLLDGLSIAELTQDNGHKDISFLTGETGQDPVRITLLVRAHRLLAATDVPAEGYYGMFREGLPSKLPALLTRTEEEQRDAIARAIEANIIPAKFAGEIDSIIKRLKALLVREAVKEPSAGQSAGSSFSDLVRLSLEDTTLREQFLSAYVNHTGTTEEFWTALSGQPSFAGRIEDLQRAIQYGALTGNHLPLVGELQRMQRSGEFSKLEDLARLDAQGWLEIISRSNGKAPIGVPPGVPGSDASERENNYARAMSHMVEDAFPTAYAARRLEADSLPGKEELHSFLVSNPDFNVRTTRVDSYLRENPEAMSEVKDEDAATQQLKAMRRVYSVAPRYEQASALMKDGITSAQSITRMGENAFVARYSDEFGSESVAKAIYGRSQQATAIALNLMMEGISSNRVSTNVAPDQAVLEVNHLPEWSTLFGSIEMCECEHCNSVYSPAAYLVDMLHFLKDRKSKVAGKNAKDILFMRRSDIGEIELTCENTNTPVPYVDLVNEALENAVEPFKSFLLDPTHETGKASRLEHALNRGVLTDELKSAFNPKLSTEAVITKPSNGRPEWYIADEPGFTYSIRKENNQLRVVARSLQTRGSAPERAASPQYVNTNVYDTTLKNAVYPWSLPFDLWSEETRAYLTHLGVARSQIIESFQPGGRADILENLTVACEYLGLTQEQAGIITGVTTGKPVGSGQTNTEASGLWNLWGFEAENLSSSHSIPDPSDSTLRIASGTWLDVLSGRVGIFLQQSGVSYKEMLDLLETYYVNPHGEGGRKIGIAVIGTNPPDTCETDKLRLAGFDLRAAARAVRFARLCRALGWDTRDLDRAIQALGATEFDELSVDQEVAESNNKFLVQLSHVQRLRATLSVPVLRLLSWWADIDAESYIDHDSTGQLRAASLYDQLFRNRAVINPPDPAFTENPENLSGKLTEHAGTISAALGINATDFARLLSDANVIPQVPGDRMQPPNNQTRPDDTLSLRRLSQLHRHSSLAKALSLSVRDYLTLLRLFGADPFATTTNTLLFVEGVKEALDCGFTVAELDYLLRHASAPESGIAPDDEATAALLSELREGLWKLDAENAFRDDTSDPDLLPRLRRTLSEQLVVQKMAEALKIETRSADALLRTWLSSPVDKETDPAKKRRCLSELLDPAFAKSNANVKISPSEFPAQFKTFLRLYKASVIAARLKLTHNQLEWLFKYGQVANWLDLNTLPSGIDGTAASLDGLLRLADLAKLRDGLHQGEKALGELLTLAGSVAGNALDAEKNAAKEAWFEEATKWTKWPRADLEACLGPGNDYTKTGAFKASFPEAYVGEHLLLRLSEALGLLKRIGISAEQAIGLAGADVKPEAARIVRQAVRAKYDEAQWLNIAKPLYDVLREKRRAALVAYLIANLKLPQNVRDADDLYAHFLLDVEMDPCMMTSRIKQAISSVQLFVQRCLMNLERDVAANAEADAKWSEWKWMKNYRVWEANRKIFLYAENWIEPELRDDKSPFFAELEAELLQSDLTQQTAEDAFMHYVEKLDQVAHLEVVGVYHQLEQDSANNVVVDILHVFARVSGIPHIYYYRKQVDSAYWTAWERIDLDIEGEHLIPVMWNGRLMLFWPIFTEKAEPMTVAFSAGTLSGGDPRKYWELTLAWSERKQESWTTKRVSSTTHRIPFPLTSRNGRFVTLADDPRRFFFRTLIDEHDNLHVIPLDKDLVDFIKGSHGKPYSFRFDSYHEPVLSSAWGDVIEEVSDTSYDRMFYKEGTKESMLLPGSTNISPTLAKTPGTFLILPYADGSKVSDSAFFYRDDRCTFLVIPSPPPTIGRSWSNQSTADAGLTLQFPWHYWKEAARLSSGGATVVGSVNNLVPSRLALSVSKAGPQQTGLMRIGDGLLVVQGANTGTPMMMLPIDGGEPTPDDDGLPITDPPGRSEPGGVLAPPSTGGAGSASAPVAVRYTFQTFYHPWVSAFVRELNRKGVEGLLQRRLQTEPQRFAPSGITALEFKTVYAPGGIVLEPYPKEEVEFEEDGSYALYNWELFFHAPLLIADRLSKNQRYEEAQKWFHYIFDPTETSADGAPQRYWRTKPFFERTREGYQRERIENILRLLAKGANSGTASGLSEQDRQDIGRFKGLIDRWRKDPFKPHLIARTRTTAYQKTVVMKYLDNLIGWADQLFRRDTIESINEATQLYIMAAEILGRRPQEIPPRANPRVQTYNTIERKLDAFSGALVEIEELISPPPDGNTGASSGQQTALTMAGMLLFCVPKNDKLLAYWDTVADRLFKIRNCMNIEGVVRQLPLFEPPIEPGLLVKAAAAGVDLNTALNDVSAATPYYRFNVMAQKASELCSELKGLGQAMLAALEKRDAERLSLIRAEHETSLLSLAKEVRKLQLDEAARNVEALNKSRETVVSRWSHYQQLLGAKKPQTPEFGANIPEIEPSEHVIIRNNGGIKVIPYEEAEGNKLREANDNQSEAASHETHAGIAHVIPNWNVQPWGVGATFGGSNVGAALSAVASYFRSQATQLSYEANRSARLAQYAMRAHDWTLQNNLAAREIMQIDQQLLAAELRRQIAVRELSNHRRQVDNAREVEDFMRDKYTNQQLYGWMMGQLATVYFQTYQLAYDLAKRAEQAYRNELAVKDSSFIQFGYWDSLKKGLLAGERLYHDIKRMEVAYLDQNNREYEITKHISLSQLDPVALIQLRQTGECVLRVPEALFDLDFPGHYMRRIKSASLSIPCVTGPYTGVHCTLTLLKSALRRTGTLLNNKYERQEGDPRFADNIGAIQSVVTSSGQNDTGLFETNLRDERYLPFEGAGTISEWRLELTETLRQFDYDTISDVILHLRYTARDGGTQLKRKAASELRTAIDTLLGGESGLALLFSLRHDFPTEWSAFVSGKREFTATIRKDYFPYFTQGKTIAINALELYAADVTEPDQIGDPAAATAALSAQGQFTIAASPAPTSGQVFLIVRYTAI